MKKKKILISACLTGEKCRYDGKNQLDKRVVDLAGKYDLISVCPEKLGGLKIPRPPAEIVPGREGKVMDETGKDVTELFIKGAEKTLEIIRSKGIKVAVLKDKSPSCGSRFVYSGDFSGTLVEGIGITAELLIDKGIKVLDENDFEEELK
ncbi:MAG: DUF523 domain-containing protein [Acidobacteriota bacterium]